MKVKSLRDHNNAYGVDQGKPYEKKVGSVYDVPEGDEKALIDQKLVELHTSEKK